MQGRGGTCGEEGGGRDELPPFLKEVYKRHWTLYTVQQTLGSSSNRKNRGWDGEEGRAG